MDSKRYRRQHDMAQFLQIPVDGHGLSRHQLFV
jgi:hypothetical protein